MLTQAMYHARELAMTRMEEEADQLGADGVVGVRLTIGRYDWGADLAEFIAVGTAVKHREGELHRAPDGRPFTSDLSGQDFSTLLRAGYRPVGLVMGNCVYHVAHQSMRQSWRQIGRNLEMTELHPGALRGARARDGADAGRGRAAAGRWPGRRAVQRASHGWGSHVIEFFAIATAVIPTQADHIIEKPALVLPLTGCRRPAGQQACAFWRARARAIVASAWTTSRSSRRSTRTRGPRRFQPVSRAGARPPARVDLRGRPGRDRDARLIAFRLRGYGAENVPDGPLILAPNHASFMDHFFCAACIRRHVQFMAKSQLFGKGSDELGVQPRRRIPGAARPPRRGGVHHRLQDPRARRRRRHVRRGRALTHRRGRHRSAAGDRPAGARVRCARSCRSGSSAPTRCATGSAASSRRCSSSTATPIAYERVESSTREQQQQIVADEILRRIRELHDGARRRPAVDARPGSGSGRRATLMRLHEQRPAPRLDPLEIGAAALAGTRTAASRGSRCSRSSAASDRAL